MIACTAIFHPLPSSFILWARRNASSPKTAASSCCSSIFFLSKILPSSLRVFSVSRLSAEMSCVGFSLMSMVLGAMADFVVLLASPLTGMRGWGQVCRLCSAHPPTYGRSCRICGRMCRCSLHCSPPRL